MIKRMLAALLCLVLMSCGDGEILAADPSLPQATKVEVKFNPNVKSLNDAGAGIYAELDGGVTSVAASQAATSGDVIIYNGKALKLGASLGNSLNGAALFETVEPKLSEIYSSLIVDGEFTSGSLIQPTSSSSIRALAFQLKKTACNFIFYINPLSSGAKCELSYEDDSSPVKISGNVEATVGGSFDRYDLISHEGRGTIVLTIAGKGSLSVANTNGVGTFGKDSSACSSIMKASPGRQLLTTININTTVVGLYIKIPFCVAVGAKADFNGEIFSIAPKYQVVLEKRKEDKFWRALDLPSVEPDGEEPKSGFWSLSESGRSTLSAAGTMEVAFESSVELTAVGLAYVGIMNRLSYTGVMDAQFSPARAAGNITLNSVEQFSQACFNLTIEGGAQVDGFLGWNILNDLSGQIKLLEVKNKNPFKRKFGECGLSTASIVITTSTNQAVKNEPFTVDVEVRSSPTNNELRYIEKPSGKVDIVIGNISCTSVELKDGKASCEGVSSYVGDVTIQASYRGDSIRYKPSVSTPFSQRVVTRFDTSDYAFEFRDRSVGTATCRHLLARDGNSPNATSGYYADFYHCTRYVTPEIRCVGPACLANRFIFSEFKYSSEQQRATLYAGAQTCAPEVELLVRDQRYANYHDTYELGAANSGWYTMTTTFKPIYVESSFNEHLSNFMLAYRKDYSNITVPSGSIQTMCGLTSTKYVLSIKVFDTSNSSYSTHDAVFDLPAISE